MSSPLSVLPLYIASLDGWLFEKTTNQLLSLCSAVLSKARLPAWQQPLSPSKKRNTVQIFLFSRGFDSASPGKTQLVLPSLLMLDWVVSLPSLFSWMRNDLLSLRSWDLPDLPFPVIVNPVTPDKCCFLHSIAQEQKRKIMYPAANPTFSLSLYTG